MVFAAIKNDVSPARRLSVGLSCVLCGWATMMIIILMFLLLVPISIGSGGNTLPLLAAGRETEARGPGEDVQCGAAVQKQTRLFVACLLLCCCFFKCSKMRFSVYIS